MAGEGVCTLTLAGCKLVQRPRPSSDGVSRNYTPKQGVREPNVEVHELSNYFAEAVDCQDVEEKIICLSERVEQCEPRPVFGRTFYTIIAAKRQFAFFLGVILVAQKKGP